MLDLFMNMTILIAIIKHIIIIIMKNEYDITVNAADESVDLLKDGKLVAYYDEQKIRRDVDFTDFATECDAEDWYWATEQDYVSGILGVPADVAAAFIASARERFHRVFCVGAAAAQELEAELSDRRRGIR